MKFFGKCPKESFDLLLNKYLEKTKWKPLWRNFEGTYGVVGLKISWKESLDDFYKSIHFRMGSREDIQDKFLETFVDE